MPLNYVSGIECLLFFCNVRFGTHVSGGDTVSRSVRINNPTMFGKWNKKDLKNKKPRMGGNPPTSGGLTATICQKD